MRTMTGTRIPCSLRSSATVSCCTHIHTHTCIHDKSQFYAEILRTPIHVTKNRAHVRTTTESRGVSTVLDCRVSGADWCRPGRVGVAYVKGGAGRLFETRRCGGQRPIPRYSLHHRKALPLAVREPVDQVLLPVCDDLGLLAPVFLLHVASSCVALP